MTPEGAVKAKVRKLLAQYDGMYAYWPVPSGFGQTTIDVIGCFRGRFFAVETKAKGKKPTLRQHQTLTDIQTAQGETFVIDDPSGSEFARLRTWLDTLEKTVPHAPHITPDSVRRSAL